MCNLLSHRTNRTFFNALNNFDLVYFLLFLPTFTHLFTVLSQKKARASVLFSIQSEGLVCNQRASRVACNPSLRDGMASRFSAYSRFSAFGLIPYITSWWFHTRLRRNSIQGFALISYTPAACEIRCEQRVGGFNFTFCGSRKFHNLRSKLFHRERKRTISLKTDGYVRVRIHT